MEKSLACPQCGTMRMVTLRGGTKFLICPACGQESLYSDRASEEDTLLFVANDLLLAANFDDAVENYSRVLARFPNSHAAHWGMLLGEYGIQFVDDIIENKKVPTMHNTTIMSVLDSVHYKKALELAPPDIANFYRENAVKFEKIRKEWLEKASKEKPYDIFLCYKESDRPNGVIRTQDSNEAYVIYNHLREQCYNVFFSRESLRDKVAERFEPYIYNALNTASVMIVYGSKPEYFASTWMKNEWSRYVAKIKRNEKQPNSIVVAYEGTAIADLPKVFQSMQCMDAKSKTFFGDLDSHIQKVIAVTKRPVAPLDVRDIKTGVIGKKATKVNVQQVARTSLGNIDVPQLTQDDNMKLATAMKYCNRCMFNNALTLLNDILLRSSYNAGAIWGKLLATLECEDAEKLKYKTLLPQQYDQIKAAITYANNAAEASVYLQAASDLAFEMLKTEKAHSMQLVDIVMSFKSSVGDKLLMDIGEMSNNLLSVGKFDQSMALFRLFLKYFDGTKVDDYIALHTSRMNVAQSKSNFSYAIEMAKAILVVDEGNVDALWAILCSEIKSDSTKELKNVEYFVNFGLLEQVLSYCKNEKDGNEYLEILLSSLILRIDKVNAENSSRAIDRVMSYLKNYRLRARFLTEAADKFLSLARYDLAERYYALIVTKDSLNYVAFWKLLLAKNKCRNDDRLLLAPRNINENPEFDSAITAAMSAGDDKFVDTKLDLVKMQPIAKKKVLAQKQAADKKIRFEQEKLLAQQKAAKKAHRKGVAEIVSLTLAFVFALSIIIALSLMAHILASTAAIAVLSILIISFSISIICYYAASKRKHRRLHKTLILAILTVFCCTISFAVISNQPEYEYKVNSEGGITITSFNNNTSGKLIEIPSRIDGKIVTRIGDGAFKDCKGADTIIIPTTVREIENYAFRRASVKSIFIPYSVSVVRDYAFEGCNSLTIYCGIWGKPERWNSNWNALDNNWLGASAMCPVKWGMRWTGSTFVKI